MTTKTPIGIDATELHSWFERDRAHVELRNTATQETIVEWWDEAVHEAIEYGFLRTSHANPRGIPNRSLHHSAYEYARDHGLLPDDPNAKRLERNRKARERRAGIKAAYDPMGLVKVRGALGGTYYE